MLKKGLRFVAVSASILILAACSSTHRRGEDMSAINSANDSYNAQASGLGQQSGFGEDAARQGLAKRTYYFDFDSNVVHQDDKASILANADYLANHPRQHVIVEGHTDPRGSREYNIGLGERRAKAIAQILMAKGVNPSQLRIVSYGAEKLAAPGHTEADYQLDRRVVLVYIHR